MNILLVGGDAKARAESLNALQLAFGQETSPQFVDSFVAARRELQSGQYQIVLDLVLAEEARWRLVRRLDPLMQVIMILESDKEDLAADALRQGASKVLVWRHTYPAVLPLIVERAYEHYLLLARRRTASHRDFDLETLGELARTVTQAMDQARTALREIDVLLEKSREELAKRRTILRQAGSEVQRRERGLKALSPLQAGGTLLGGLVVVTRHAGKLRPRDVRWLGVMGQQVGVAIENARSWTQAGWEQDNLLGRVMSGERVYFADSALSSSDGLLGQRRWSASPYRFGSKAWAR